MGSLATADMWETNFSGVCEGCSAFTTTPRLGGPFSRCNLVPTSYGDLAAAALSGCVDRRMKEPHFSVNSVVMHKVVKEAMVQSKGVEGRGSPPCGLYNRHFFNRCGGCSFVKPHQSEIVSGQVAQRVWRPAALPDQGAASSSGDHLLHRRTTPARESLPSSHVGQREVRVTVPHFQRSSCPTVNRWMLVDDRFLDQTAAHGTNIHKGHGLRGHTREYRITI